MRFLTLAAAALLGLLMILATFARHVADSTSWDRSNDGIWAGNMLWVVLLLWALGVMLVTAWPLIAMVAFGIAGGLAADTMLSMAAGAGTLDRTMVFWLLLSVLLGVASLVEWRSNPKANAHRYEREHHVHREAQTQR